MSDTPGTPRWPFSSHRSFWQCQTGDAGQGRRSQHLSKDSLSSACWLQEQLKTLLALNSAIEQVLSCEHLCIQHASRTQLHRERRQSSVCSPACSQPENPWCPSLRKKNESICHVTSPAQNTFTQACAGGGVMILLSA